MPSTRKCGGGKSSTRSDSSSSSASRSSLASKRESKRRFVCPICDDEVRDRSGSFGGDEAVECEGVCAAWLHTQGH